VIAAGDASDRNEETLAYYGPHPVVMTERLKKLPGSFGRPVTSLVVYGEAAVSHPALKYSSEVREVLRHKPEEVVLLKSLPLFRRLTNREFRTGVPRAMKSPNARPWTPEFRLSLLLAEKGFTL
jgi:hypothetical protein